MDVLKQFIPFIITTLSKESNMNFLIGFILGLAIGGLFAVYVLPAIWKPKN